MVPLRANPQQGIHSVIATVPASPAHVGRIATRIRAIDAIECAAFGHTPKSALRAALSGSSLAWTAKADGAPVAMFGASTVSTLEGIGCPWMLMTDEAPRHARALVEQGRRYSDMMLRHYARLANHVHADNAVAIRWLSRLGYDIGEIENVNGHPMRGFTRCAGQLRYRS